MNNFTITWDQYARAKAGRCCGSKCEGCVYDPKWVKFINGDVNLPNKYMIIQIQNQIKFIVPETSPSSEFQRRFDPAQQEEICRRLRERKGTQEDFKAFFGHFS